MMLSTSTDVLRYVKHNKIRLKPGKSEESTQMILEFFKELEHKEKEMKGYAVMNNMQDLQEFIVLTFWETKEAMDEFYLTDNRAVSDLVEKLKPSFEQLPKRKDYQVAKFKVW